MTYLDRYEPGNYRFPHHNYRRLRNIVQKCRGDSKQTNTLSAFQSRLDSKPEVPRSKPTENSSIVHLRKNRAVWQVGRSEGYNVFPRVEEKFREGGKVRLKVEGDTVPD